MFGAVGEKSIDFLENLYRLFQDTSEEPLEQHSINDLIVLYERTDSSHLLSQIHSCAIPFARILFADTYPFITLIRLDFCSVTS